MRISPKLTRAASLRKGALYSASPQRLAGNVETPVFVPSKLNLDVRVPHCRASSVGRARISSPRKARARAIRVDQFRLSVHRRSDEIAVAVPPRGEGWRRLLFRPKASTSTRSASPLCRPKKTSPNGQLWLDRNTPLSPRRSAWRVTEAARSRSALRPCSPSWSLLTSDNCHLI